jgi:hypothetical protein
MNRRYKVCEIAQIQLEVEIDNFKVYQGNMSENIDTRWRGEGCDFSWVALRSSEDCDLLILGVESRVSIFLSR